MAEFENTATAPVEKLAYVLGAAGMQLLLIEPATLLPWASLIDVTPLPKQPPMMRLLYRPVGAKLKQQLVINGNAYAPRLNTAHQGHKSYGASAVVSSSRGRRTRVEVTWKRSNDLH